jgi:hypothetical protein
MGSAMTTPTNVVAASFKQDFHPGTSIGPEIHRKRAILSHPWLHR